ncbi:MAG: biliverdin-producing heme oxygenase [bacterium]|nr:biliverdin-producing heme oxygenase [bacterium]
MQYMMKIREKTSLLHSAAEHSGYIKRLVDGNASVEGYAEYILNLKAMYQAIEEGLEKNKENEVVSQFVTPELYRSELMEKDLEFLLKEKKDEIQVLASTKACVARIGEISENHPELLPAYAYTRFLADLFGGRTFNALLGLKYNITEEGLNYYKFENLGDIRTYVMAYHNKLASISLSEEGKEVFLDEISNAYIYNLAISNELEAKLHPTN